MSALLKIYPASDARLAPQTMPGATAALDLLRDAARRSRALARFAYADSCAALCLEREVAPEVAAETLVRSLPEILGRRPVFRRVGEVELSFDELWLMRIMDRIAAGDQDSVGFLLRSRLSGESLRWIRFLLSKLSTQLDRT